MILSILLTCLTFILAVDAQLRCIPELGTHIQWEDCMEAFGGLFTPAVGSMAITDQATRRQFRLYDQNVQFRIPQGHAVRTCSVGFDILDGNEVSYTTSWQELQQGMLELLKMCIGRRGGVGGTSAKAGIVYAFMNPEQLSGLGTCLAPPPPAGLKRLNLAQCLMAHGSTPRQGSTEASDIGYVINRYSHDAESRGSRGRNQIAQALVHGPVQLPLLPPAPAQVHLPLLPPAQVRVVDARFFPRPPERNPGVLRRFAWRGGAHEPESVFWRNAVDGRPNILRLWKEAGGWCAIKLRGPTVPFPLEKPPLTVGRDGYGAPYWSLLVRPGGRPKVDLVWVWKSSGHNWIPFHGRVPLGDEHADHMADGYGHQSGWFLIKWVWP